MASSDDEVWEAVSIDDPAVPGPRKSRKALRAESSSSGEEEASDDSDNDPEYEAPTKARAEPVEPAVQPKTRAPSTAPKARAPESLKPRELFPSASKKRKKKPQTKLKGPAATKGSKEKNGSTHFSGTITQLRGAGDITAFIGGCRLADGDKLLYDPSDVLSEAELMKGLEEAKTRQDVEGLIARVGVVLRKARGASSATRTYFTQEALIDGRRYLAYFSRVADVKKLMQKLWQAVEAKPKQQFEQRKVTCDMDADGSWDAEQGSELERAVYRLSNCTMVYPLGVVPTGPAGKTAPADKSAPTKEPAAAPATDVPRPTIAPPKTLVIPKASGVAADGRHPAQSPQPSRTVSANVAPPQASVQLGSFHIDIRWTPQ